MRVDFAALALALCLPACATPQSSLKSDAARAELKGPVKTVSIDFQANVKDRYGQLDERHVGSSTYDANGNLVEDVDYSVDFIRKRTPERKDASTVVFHSKMGDSTEHYLFDGRGNVIEEQLRYGIRFDGSADTITRFRYDDQDREKERDFIGPDGKLTGAFIYTRDASGNVVEEEDWLNDPDAPHARMTFRYDFDAHGNWVKRYETRTGVPEDSYVFGHTGTLTRTITYYDGGAEAERQGR